MAQAETLPLDDREAACSEAAFADVLRAAIGALDANHEPYVLIGGVGSASLGRPRWTHDIDVLVAPVDADRALDALARAGFDHERTNPHWIFKATMDDVVVDIIFRTVGDVYLDDEMLGHAQGAEFCGVHVQVAAPEDQIVIKAIAHDEQSARHWNDALSLIASTDIDWDYLLERSERGARRVLSLLIYAQANDLIVPSGTIERLFAHIYGQESSDGGA
jgi:predicted nucleotidyltransferase